MMGMSLGTERRPRARKGMIAIITTMMLLIVISLIVFGFAQLTRRNQRATLDRQLSTQAFYAAESGVNDARQVINRHIANSNNITTAYFESLRKTGCKDPGSLYTGLDYTIDSASAIGYTCLTVNPTPTRLRYSSVDDRSIVIPIFSKNGTSINRVQIDMQSKTGSLTPLSGCPGAGFPPASTWSTSGCGYGVLRLDIVPVTVAGNYDFDSLRANTMTMFARPANGGAGAATFSPGPGSASLVTTMSCSQSGCTMIINGLNNTNYYMRLASIYQPMAMQISATDSTGAAVAFAAAQAIIDATGQASDVLRRIQVTIPLAASSRDQLTDYAIQTTDSLCKRFWAMDGRIGSEPQGIASGVSPLCGSFER